MESRWYVGESRADELLDYALAQLARRAHLVEPGRYLRIKQLLETRIPQWVEERRGPLDTRGYPLYSLGGYKDFISWWVQVLTAPTAGQGTAQGGAVPGGVTGMSKRSWVQEVFHPAGDPARRVFGGMATLGAAEGDGMIPEVFKIGAQRASELKSYCLEVLFSLVGEYAATPGVQDAVNEIMRAMSSLIDQWAADESKAPRDPATGKPYPDIAGPGQLERMREAIATMLSELVRVKLGGLAPTQLSGRGVWESYGMTMPAVNLQPILRQQAGAFAPPGGVAVNAAQWPFAELVKARGDDARIAFEIQSENFALGWKAESIRQVMEELLAQWPQSAYSVGPSTAAEPQGSLSADQLAKYNGELGQLKSAIVAKLKSGA